MPCPYGDWVCFVFLGRGAGGETVDWVRFAYSGAWIRRGSWVRRFGGNDKARRAVRHRVSREMLERCLGGRSESYLDDLDKARQANVGLGLKLGEWGGVVGK